MSLHSLVVKIVGDNKQFNETIANTEKKLSETTKGLETVANNMTSVGDSMTKGITLPLAAAGAVLLKIGTDFDDAYDKIRIGSGATGEALEGLKEDFKEVAKDSASSFDDISTAVADLNTRLGLTGKPLQELSKQITNVSRITETDLNTNITQSAKLFNNWQIATEKQSKTLDLMFVASQQTGIGIDRLMTSVTEYGPILRGMGYDLESATALIAGFDKAGVNVQETLATMKIAMRNLAKEGFTDPQEALSMYIEKIENAGSSIEATRIAAELFGSRGGAIMGAAIREGRLELDDLIESLKTSKETINGVAEATDDWKEKLQKLKNETMIQLEPVANKVFDSIGRAVEKVSPKIEELTKWFGSLTEEQTDNILKWGLLLAAIGPVLSIAGRTTTGIIQLRNSILLLNKATMASPILMGTAGAIGATVGAVAGTIFLTGDSAKYASDNIDKLKQVIWETEKGLANYERAAKDMAAVNAEIAPKELYERNLELLNSVQNLGSAFPELIDKTIELENSYKTGKISLDDYNNSLGKLVDEARMKNWAGQLTAVKTAMHQGRIEATNLEAAESELAEQTEEATMSIEEQGQAVDKLRDEFNKLLGDIFGHITTYNDFEEANIAVREAEKALAEAIKEHGENSDEATRAQNNLDDAMIDSIQTAFELSTSIDATAEQQEEARKKAVELGLEFINTRQIGVDQFREMAKEFDVSSGEIIAWAEEMGIVLDETTKDRIIHLGLETSGFDSSLSAAINRLNNLDVRMGLYAGGGIVGYANGGIMPKAAEGGIINKVLSASAGMITPSYDNGGILSLLHKNEVVLNAGQTKNLAELIFGLANTRFSGSQEYGDAGAPITINNVIELDGSIIYEKTEEHLYRSQRLKQIGAGIR